MSKIINIMILSLLSILILFIIIGTQTMWLHPSVRENLLDSYYTDYQDLSITQSGNSNLLILLHGMYSNPEIFREFSEQIVKKGWNVYAPALPNSANSQETLAKQGAYQWKESILIAQDKILKHSKSAHKVVLAGHSQGGSFSLSLAPELDFLSGLVIVSAPLELTHSKKRFLYNLAIKTSGLMHFLQKKGLVLWGDLIYGLTLHSFCQGLKTVRSNLDKISIPTLLIYETEDRTVDFKNLHRLQSALSNAPSIKTITTSSTNYIDPYYSYHRLFNIEPTKDIVLKEISSFLQEIQNK